MQPGKELGFWMCTALVIGNTIGMGIYLLPASLAPYGLNAMIGWTIMMPWLRNSRSLASWVAPRMFESVE